MPSGTAVQLAQLEIEERIIIRVPPLRPPPSPPGKAAERPARPPSPPAVEWDEKKGPRCVAIRSIRSAAITDPRGVDLILSSHQRYRARLERGCPSAAFYSGFYLQPSRDGALCARRDMLHARGGTACEIESFRRLVAEDK